MFGLFRKRIDPKLLAEATAAAAAKLRESADAGCSIYCTDLNLIDEAIRQRLDAQLLVLAVLRPVINLALQDAYFNAGLLLPLETLPAELTLDEERTAIRGCTMFFQTCKPNLDMRFRYMFAGDLSSSAEDELWNDMVTTIQPVVRRSFEQKANLNSFWVGAIVRLREDDIDGAQQIIDEII